MRITDGVFGFPEMRRLVFMFVSLLAVDKLEFAVIFILGRTQIFADRRGLCRWRLMLCVFRTSLRNRRGGRIKRVAESCGSCKNARTESELRSSSLRARERAGWPLSLF